MVLVTSLGPGEAAQRGAGAGPADQSEPLHGASALEFFRGLGLSYKSLCHPIGSPRDLQALHN